VSESMTSEFDGPNEEAVHCILERALAAKERRGNTWWDHAICGEGREVRDTQRLLLRRAIGRMS
jgi:hypothetical protein